MTDITEVIAYIHEARAVGMTDEDAVSQLRAVGWQPQQIREAIAYADARQWPHHHPATAAQYPRAIIQVRNLSKRYGPLTAVDDISFEVFEGETFGILGPNGAGKTTTLEMIEGLKRLSGGSITVDDKDVSTQTHAVKEVIGVQLQASSFFENLTLRELLTTFAALYHQTVDPMSLLADVQLVEKADSQVKELSGGQKQRFSIAVGLVNRPKVLFLDEPTTGLDPQARRNLWELVTHIKSRGTTVVLTTHYMDEAEVLCDRIAVMDHARIVAMDTTRNLLSGAGVSSSVEFRSGSVIQPQVLSSIEGVDAVYSENGAHFLTVSNPQRALDGLFTAARQHQFTIEELMLKRATLEDVFLKLTGHQLRD